MPNEACPKRSLASLTFTGSLIDQNVAAACRNRCRLMPNPKAFLIHRPAHSQASSWRLRPINRRHDQTHRMTWGSSCRRTRRLHRPRIVWIEHECDPRHMRCNLLEQPQPLCSYRGLDVGEPGNVAAWMCQAPNETLGDRFVGPREDDRHRDSCLLQRGHRLASTGYNHVRRERQQFPDGGLRLFNVSDAPMLVDLNVATDCPSNLSATLMQRYRTAQPLWVTLGKWHQHADTAHTLALLRTCHERPRSRAADQRDELASSHAPLNSSLTLVVACP